MTTSTTKMADLPVWPGVPACRGQGPLLDDLAFKIGGKSSPAVANRIAQPARPFCETCPFAVVEACFKWAISDGYTGVAGAHVFRNGKPLVDLHPAPPGR